MIYGIGIDLIEIARIEQAIARSGQRFIERMYTEVEQAYCRTKASPYPYYAARFAAKEAFLKALGTGLREHMRWRDIEIYHQALDKPALRLYGYLQEHCAARGITCMHLSMSHSMSHAIAQVLLERQDDLQQT